ISAFDARPIRTGMQFPTARSRDVALGKRPPPLRSGSPSGGVRRNSSGGLLEGLWLRAPRVILRTPEVPQDPEPPMADVTQILSAIEQGDASAAEQLLPLVYDELRRLAAQRLAQEKPGQTLQATALVHEAYLRLVDVATAPQWNSRAHFFAAAGLAMRR